ncbi:abortive infection family protein [Guptibacillus hwajinpoensis]|uniref:abortive infection family protein n=1 Tax=Guptibacillus hwajinpoensis TaxID=208199 RepID=UPI0024B32796|nr:abortive infection family protein [Pseudalkalibacillus hwajinpoensis]
MGKLGKSEINSVVSYIGGVGGYLGNFTYSTHADFYPSYCGLDIDPYEYEGTTKERFIKILSEASANEQSKILKGILEKYPMQYFDDSLEDETLTPIEHRNKVRLYEKITQWITQLNGEIIEHSELKYDIEFVKEVLQQADVLIANHSYSSAVDRAHTAIHGYLKEVCDKKNIIFNEQNVKIQDMWSKMKTDHPCFNIDFKDHHKPINHTVNAISKFLESMNDIRNRHGFSHPNEDIIEEKEARLIINLSRVLLYYIDSKVTS